MPCKTGAARLHEKAQPSRLLLPNDMARCMSERFALQQFQRARHSAPMVSRTCL